MLEHGYHSGRGAGTGSCLLQRTSTAKEQSTMQTTAAMQGAGLAQLQTGRCGHGTDTPASRDGWLSFLAFSHVLQHSQEFGDMCWSVSLPHGEGHLYVITPWSRDHDPIPEPREARPSEVKVVSQGCAEKVTSGLGSVPSVCCTAMVGRRMCLQCSLSLSPIHFTMLGIEPGLSRMLGKH